MSLEVTRKSSRTSKATDLTDFASRSPLSEKDTVPEMAEKTVTPEAPDHRLHSPSLRPKCPRKPHNSRPIIPKSQGQTHFMLCIVQHLMSPKFPHLASMGTLLSSRQPEPVLGTSNCQKLPFMLHCEQPIRLHPEVHILLIGQRQ